VPVILMGLDSVEIIMDIEDRFGIEIIMSRGSMVEGRESRAALRACRSPSSLVGMSATRLLRRARWALLAMTHQA
jgi:hypothetical protein